MKTRALLFVSCLIWASSSLLNTSVFGQPIVSIELVQGDAIETRIDQNAIFWAEFRVLRTGPATNELIVLLNTQQGSARLGEDYWLDGAEYGSTVRIPAGTNSVNVRLYPKDDPFYEGDETVHFHLIAPPPWAAPYEIDLAHSFVDMVIHDNDPVTTRLDIVSPRNGQQFQPGDLIELRAQVIGPGNSNSWSVEFSDGDHSIGKTRSDSPIWWSDASGGTHAINARAIDSQGTMLTSEPPVTVQVGPGARLPVVKISADPWRTGEPCPVCRVAPAILIIERTAPTNTGLTVYLETDGTAIPEDDYQPLPAKVEIPAGQRSVQLTLLARDDQLAEGPEVVRVRLLPQPPPLLPPTYFVSVHAQEALVVIFDDEREAPQARLDIVTPSNGAHLEFPSIVQLSAFAVNMKNEVYGPVDFYVGDRLVARSPVVASARPPIPGLPSVHTAYWTNPPVGQYVLTARTRLSLDQTLMSPPVKVTVESPTLPVVSLETFPLENPQAREFCPPNLDCAYPSFIVRRTGSTDADLRVYLSYSGTAAPEVDYPALPDSVVIPAGREAVSLMLVPYDDALIEGPESVIAGFTPVPGHGYIQDPNHASATITILDNDGPRPTVVSIRTEDSRATELPPWVDAIDPARFQVSRSGDLSKDLIVFFSLGGSAAPGVDYQALNSPIRIPAGADSASMVVWPVYDELKEGMETVLIRLEPSPLAGPQPTYEIDSHADFAVAGIFDLLPEQGPAIQIVSPRDGDHFNPATPIDIIVAAFHPSQDVLGADFYAGADRLGEWRLTPAVQNAGTVVAHRFTWSQPSQGTHTLTAQGLDITHTIFATSPPVKVTVEGELSPPIVSIETISRISEESSAPFKRLPLVGAFRISRTGPVSNSLPVYVTCAGTALSGDDYRPLPFLATIPEGTNSVLLPVQPVVDDRIEGLETVVATISNCPPFPLDPPCFNFSIDPTHDTATVFIRDDGLTEVSLAINNPTNGASFKFGETILIDAVAIDLESYISRVEFFDGDHLLGVSELFFLVAPPPGTPIKHSFEWHDATRGAHALTARAARATGEIVTSQPVRIAVDADGNQAPAVAITQPANGAVLPPSTPIEIIVKTFDPDGYVRTVEFFADGRKIGERNVGTIPPLDPGQPKIFSFLWATPAPDQHVLTARAIDNASAGVLSAPVEIRVALDGLPIVVVSTTDNVAVEPTVNSELDTATFRLRRFGSTNTSLTVVYSLRGTAQNGIDYELLSGSAVIPPGSSTTNIVVRPLADQLAERLETVVLRLEEQSQYHLGLRRRAIALISDTRPTLGSVGVLSSWLPDGCFHACFAASIGGTFRVEASTDLLNWETVLTTTADNGSLNFIEDEATNFLHRFYRLAPEPVPGPND